MCYALRISTQWENLLCARSISQGIVLRLLFFSDERHEKEFEEGDVSNHLEKILSNTIKAESTIGE